MNIPMTREVERRLALEDAERDLLRHWPHDPYRFGDELATKAKSLIVESSPLREDRSFIEDVMRAILARARTQGVVFAPEIDVVILDSGAAHVTDHKQAYGRDWRACQPAGEGL